MKTTATLFTALLLQLAMQPQAQAQEIWRCGADGRSYSSTPCSEGRVVATSDARPAADVAAAQRQAQQEARLAEKLRHEHLQDDARRLGSGFGLLSAARPTPVVVKPSTAQPVLKTGRTAHHRPAANGTSPAIVPVSRRATG